MKNRWAYHLGIMMFPLGMLISSCEKNTPSDDIVVISATGNITPKVDEFRQLLGATLNTTPGAVGGRREINWDGVPDNLLGQALPSDFFNPTGDGAPASRQRGLVYAGGSGDFRVSKTNFSEVNQKATTEFAAFSGDRSFANVSANLWDIYPKVAGKDENATVKGFGIVFSDVDTQNGTYLEFFNETASIGKFYVPQHTSASSFSFLGVYFKSQKVTRIRVVHQGKLIDNEPDISNGGTKDLITLDDFLYDEPVKK
jgi:hypothetical protein